MVGLSWHNNNNNYNNLIVGTLAAACLPVAVLFIDTLVSQPCACVCIPDNFHALASFGQYLISDSC